MSNNWKKTIKFAKTVTSNNQIRQYGTVRKGQIYHFRIHRLCHSLDPIYRNADCCQQIQSGYFCKADCLCMQQPFRLAALLLLLDSHLRRIRNLQNQVRQEKDACHRDHNSSGRAVPRSAWAYNTVIIVLLEYCITSIHVYTHRDNVVIIGCSWEWDSTLIP